MSRDVEDLFVSGLICWKRRNKVTKKSVFSVYCTQIFLCSTEGVEVGVCVQWVAGGWGTGAGWDRKQVWVILGRGKQTIAAGTVC